TKTHHTPDPSTFSRTRTPMSAALLLGLSCKACHVNRLHPLDEACVHGGHGTEARFPSGECDAMHPKSGGKLGLCRLEAFAVCLERLRVHPCCLVSLVTVAKCYIMSRARLRVLRCFDGERIGPCTKLRRSFVGPSKVLRRSSGAPPKPRAGTGT